MTIDPAPSGPGRPLLGQVGGRLTQPALVPDAGVQAGLFAPRDGAFNAPTAAALTRWKEE